MARTTPGEVARAFPKTPPDAPQPIDEIFATLDATIVPGADPLRPSALLRLLPDRRQPVVGARRLPEHRPRRARPDLAVGAGADRARRGDHRLGAADGRPVAGVARRHPGHRVDGDARRAGLRARAGVQLRPHRRRTAGRRIAARRLRLGPEPQLGAEGGARRRLRTRLRARDRDRRQPRDASRGARSRDARGSRPRLDAVRGRRDVGLDHLHRLRSDRRDRGPLRRARRLAARRRGDGRIGDGARGVPAAVGRRRARRLDRAEPAQVARRDLRLLALPGPRSRAPRAGHEHQPGLPAVDGGERGDDVSRLGHRAGPALPRLEAVDADPPRRRRRHPRPHRARSRPRALARRRRRRHAGLARRRPGAAADGLRAPRAARPRRRGAGRSHARVVRPRQRVRRRVSHRRRPRRTLDGPRRDGRSDDRAPARRGDVAGDAGRGHAG